MIHALWSQTLSNVPGHGHAEERMPKYKEKGAKPLASNTTVKAPTYDKTHGKYMLQLTLVTKL